MMHKNPNLDMSISMQNLVEFCWFVLKILRSNQDLININAYKNLVKFYSLILKV